MLEPISTFIAYHPKDEALLKDFERHLADLSKAGLLRWRHMGMLPPVARRRRMIFVTLTPLA